MRGKVDRNINLLLEIAMMLLRPWLIAVTSHVIQNEFSRNRAAFFNKVSCRCCGAANPHQPHSHSSEIAGAVVQQHLKGTWLGKEKEKWDRNTAHSLKCMCSVSKSKVWLSAYLRYRLIQQKGIFTSQSCSSLDCSHWLRVLKWFQVFNSVF